MWLERIDAMTAEVLRLLRKSGRRDVVLVVTGDHTTPAVYGDHTCEPVPIVFCDVFDPDLNIVEQHSTYIHSDNTKKFDEIEAGIAGSLGRFPALEIMTLVKGLLHGPND